MKTNPDCPDDESKKDEKPGTKPNPEKLAQRERGGRTFAGHGKEVKK